jgi:E3 ubiquitin-protein ligase MYCBP2
VLDASRFDAGLGLGVVPLPKAEQLTPDQEKSRIHEKLAALVASADPAAVRAALLAESVNFLGSSPTDDSSTSATSLSTVAALAADLRSDSAADAERALVSLATLSASARSGTVLFAIADAVSKAPPGASVSVAQVSSLLKRFTATLAPLLGSARLGWEQEPSKVLSFPPLPWENARVIAAVANTASPALIAGIADSTQSLQDLLVIQHGKEPASIKALFPTLWVRGNVRITTFCASALVVDSALLVLVSGFGETLLGAAALDAPTLSPLFIEVADDRGKNDSDKNDGGGNDSSANDDSDDDDDDDESDDNDDNDDDNGSDDEEEDENGSEEHENEDGASDGSDGDSDEEGSEPGADEDDGNDDSGGAVEAKDENKASTSLECEGTPSFLSIPFAPESRASIGPVFVPGFSLSGIVLSSVSTKMSAFMFTVKRESSKVFLSAISSSHVELPKTVSQAVFYPSCLSARTIPTHGARALLPLDTGSFLALDDSGGVSVQFSDGRSASLGRGTTAKTALRIEESKWLASSSFVPRDDARVASKINEDAVIIGRTRYLCVGRGVLSWTVRIQGESDWCALGLVSFPHDLEKGGDKYYNDSRAFIGFRDIAISESKDRVHIFGHDAKVELADVKSADNDSVDFAVDFATGDVLVRHTPGATSIRGPWVLLARADLSGKSFSPAAYARREDSESNPRTITFESASIDFAGTAGDLLANLDRGEIPCAEFTTTITANGGVTVFSHGSVKKLSSALVAAAPFDEELAPPLLSSADFLTFGDICAISGAASSRVDASPHAFVCKSLRSSGFNIVDTIDNGGGDVVQVQVLLKDEMPAAAVVQDRATAVARIPGVYAKLAELKASVGPLAATLAACVTGSAEAAVKWANSPKSAPFFARASKASTTATIKNGNILSRGKGNYSFGDDGRIRVREDCAATIATRPLTEGRWYFEFDVVDVRGWGYRIGFARTDVAPDAKVGDADGSWGWNARDENAMLYGVSCPVDPGGAAVPNSRRWGEKHYDDSTILVAVDIDAGTICFGSARRGGSSKKDPFMAPHGIAFAGLDLRGVQARICADSSLICGIRIGDKKLPFKSDPPPGFTPLYMAFDPEHFVSGAGDAVVGAQLALRNVRNLRDQSCESAPRAIVRGPSHGVIVDAAGRAWSFCDSEVRASKDDIGGVVPCVLAHPLSSIDTPVNAVAAGCDAFLLLDEKGAAHEVECVDGALSVARTFALRHPSTESPARSIAACGTTFSAVFADGRAVRWTRGTAEASPFQDVSGFFSSVWANATGTIFMPSADTSSNLNSCTAVILHESLEAPDNATKLLVKMNGNGACTLQSRKGFAEHDSFDAPVDSIFQLGGDSLCSTIDAETVSLWHVRSSSGGIKFVRCDLLAGARASPSPPNIFSFIEEINTMNQLNADSLVRLVSEVLTDQILLADDANAHIDALSVLRRFRDVDAKISTTQFALITRLIAWRAFSAAESKDRSSAIVESIAVAAETTLPLLALFSNPLVEQAPAPLPDAATSELEPSLTLTVTEGPHKGKSISLAPKSFVLIGRVGDRLSEKVKTILHEVRKHVPDVTADLTPHLLELSRDGAASGLHAVLIKNSDGSLLLFDLGSTNGTFAAKRAIPKLGSGSKREHAFTPAEAIYVGDTRILIRAPRGASSPTTKSPVPTPALLTKPAGTREDMWSRVSHLLYDCVSCDSTEGPAVLFTQQRLAAVTLMRAAFVDIRSLSDAVCILDARDALNTTRLLSPGQGGEGAFAIDSPRGGAIASAVSETPGTANQHFERVVRAAAARAWLTAFGPKISTLSRNGTLANFDELLGVSDLRARVNLVRRLVALAIALPRPSAVKSAAWTILGALQNSGSVSESAEGAPPPLAFAISNGVKRVDSLGSEVVVNADNWAVMNSRGSFTSGVVTWTFEAANVSADGFVIVGVHFFANGEAPTIPVEGSIYKNKNALSMCIDTGQIYADANENKSIRIPRGIWRDEFERKRILVDFRADFSRDVVEVKRVDTGEWHALGKMGGRAIVPAVSCYKLDKKRNTAQVKIKSLEVLGQESPRVALSSSPDVATAIVEQITSLAQVNPQSIDAEGWRLLHCSLEVLCNLAKGKYGARGLKKRRPQMRKGPPGEDLEEGCQVMLIDNPSGDAKDGPLLPGEIGTFHGGAHVRALPENEDDPRRKNQSWSWHYNPSNFHRVFNSEDDDKKNQSSADADAKIFDSYCIDAKAAIATAGLLDNAANAAVAAASDSLDAIVANKPRVRTLRLLETAHPYRENSNETFSVSLGTLPALIVVAFDPRCATVGDDCTKVEIIDSIGRSPTSVLLSGPSPWLSRHFFLSSPADSSLRLTFTSGAFNPDAPASPAAMFGLRATVLIFDVPSTGLICMGGVGRDTPASAVAASVAALARHRRAELLGLAARMGPPVLESNAIAAARTKALNDIAELISVANSVLDDDNAGVRDQAALALALASMPAAARPYEPLVKPSSVEWCVTSLDGNGSCNWRSDDNTTLFHFNPRSNENQIVMNTFSNGEWGVEERIELPAERPLTASILVDAAGYHVVLGGVECHVYQHRVPFERSAKVVFDAGWSCAKVGAESSLLYRIVTDVDVIVRKFKDFSQAIGVVPLRDKSFHRGGVGSRSADVLVRGIRVDGGWLKIEPATIALAASHVSKAREKEQCRDFDPAIHGFIVLRSGGQPNGSYIIHPDDCINRAGAPMAVGNEVDRKTKYCGRVLGRDAIPHSDGQCGPNNGPQCDDCKATVATVAAAKAAAALAEAAPPPAPVFSTKPRELSAPVRRAFIAAERALLAASADALAVPPVDVVGRADPLQLAASRAWGVFASARNLGLAARTGVVSKLEMCADSSSDILHSAAMSSLFAILRLSFPSATSGDVDDDDDDFSSGGGYSSGGGAGARPSSHGGGGARPISRAPSASGDDGPRANVASILLFSSNDVLTSRQRRKAETRARLQGDAFELFVDDLRAAARAEIDARVASKASSSSDADAARKRATLAAADASSISALLISIIPTAAATASPISRHLAPLAVGAAAFACASPPTERAVALHLLSVLLTAAVPATLDEAFERVEPGARAAVVQLSQLKGGGASQIPSGATAIAALLITAMRGGAGDVALSFRSLANSSRTREKVFLAAAADSLPIPLVGSARALCGAIVDAAGLGEHPILPAPEVTKGAAWVLAAGLAGVQQAVAAYRRPLTGAPPDFSNGALCVSLGALIAVGVARFGAFDGLGAPVREGAPPLPLDVALAQAATGTSHDGGAAPPPRAFCDNHSDGLTRATRSCVACVKRGAEVGCPPAASAAFFCAPCDAVLHLARATKTHARTDILVNAPSSSETATDAGPLSVTAARARLTVCGVSIVMSIADAPATLIDVDIDALLPFVSAGSALDNAQSLSLSTAVSSSSSAVATCRLCYEEMPSGACADPVCAFTEARACTHKLACGHACAGVHAVPGASHDATCPSCIHGCGGDDKSACASESCCICYTDRLDSAPIAKMPCGHTFHFHCARRALAKGYQIKTGPRISFAHGECPLRCNVSYAHPALEDLTQRLADLETGIVAKLPPLLAEFSKPALPPPDALARVHRQALHNALRKLNFYECSKCPRPFFGGIRRCGQAGAAGGGGGEEEEEGAGEEEEEEENLAFNPADLVCGGCASKISGIACELHGEADVVFKCRYCCSPAVFFCFGTTHFCDGCHGVYQRMQKMNGEQGDEKTLPQCPAAPKGVHLPNGTPCPLGVEHPPNGVEHVLGCATCAMQNSARVQRALRSP